MNERFKNKYRIASARLKNWDYGWNAAYFVTICTQNREYFFGNVVDSKMILSSLGEIANHLWSEISDRFPYVKLTKYVVMPNHVHGIVVIDKSSKLKVANMNADITADTNVSITPETRMVDTRLETRMVDTRLETRLETRLIASLPQNNDNENSTGGITGCENPMLHENLSKIIRWYKGRTSFECRKIDSNFAWQPRFHDHIIRNEESFRLISKYITRNPINWKDDEYR